MNKKLFLLDAYALIYRAYYALIRSPRINSKGQNTSAIFGFVNILEDVLKKEQPTHIAVAFDPAGPTFRHEVYPEYKANRQVTPEDIKLSVPIIKDIINAYNIPILEVSGFEADDVIGTVSKLAEKSGFDVYMLTPDKDYAQLVSNHIFIYRPKQHGGGYDIYGVKEACENWNISNTSQIIDLLALMGDASDNYPGCKGVGEKTAIDLLNRFGSVENILNNTNELKGALKKKIEEGVESINFSKFLATIRLDVPFDFNESLFEKKSPDYERLAKIYTELEFKTHLSKLPILNKKNEPVQLSLFDNFQDNIQEKIKYSNLSELSSSKHLYQLIENEKDIDEFLVKISCQDFFCFDTETTGTDTISSDLVGISFCWKENEAYIIILPTNRVEAEKIVKKFKPLFENENIMKIGQNIKFDLLMLRNYDIELKGNLFDTMIAHYVIQPELKHNMDYLAEIYLNYKTITYEELIGENKNKKNIRDVELSKLCDYAAEDADITFKLYNKLKEEIKNNNLENLFFNVEMPLIYVLAEMEYNGVIIDIDSLKNTSFLFNEKLVNIEKDIYKEAGIEFNISSPKQVGEIIYDKLKIIENPKKTKTGSYSTSEEVLKSLQGKHPLIDKILDFRGYKKLLSTYVDNLPTMINSKTGRIHTSFNQTITATGRLSSSNPNLQNIPVRDDNGKEIRKAFICDKDCVYISADYSQIELRIMAHLSEDPNLIEDFNNGYDIHRSTASKIYKCSLEVVTSDMRRKAKTANFGIIYGISAFGLAERLNISRKESNELISEYFINYPRIKEYIQECISYAQKNGYVETILGRKRFLPDINSRNGVVRGFAERNAVNAPIQGSAADIIKIAMINIYKKFKENKLRSQMMLQVHDELNFNVYREELDIVKDIIVNEMQNAVELKVPLIVDCGIGDNWLEAH